MKITWQYLLDVHGGKIGALCILLSFIITGFLIIKPAYRAVVHELDNGRQVVAEARGK